MQITVKELYDYCAKEINAGNGDKHIVVSDDNEGNGYHGMFYGFTPWDDEFESLIYDSQFNSADDTIVLG